jgi:hypothetical protein
MPVGRRLIVVMRGLMERECSLGYRQNEAEEGRGLSERGGVSRSARERRVKIEQKAGGNAPGSKTTRRGSDHERKEASQAPVAAVASRKSRARVVRLDQTSARKMKALARGSP